MSDAYDCVLTFATPEALEDELLELLLAQEDLVTGFSVYSAEGLGTGAPLHTALERVRGRSNRRMIAVLLGSSDAVLLIERIRSQLSTPDIAWWLTPVTGFGRLG